MGGFVRFFRSVFRKPKAPAPVAQTISAAQPIQAEGRRVSKPYSKETIMTSAEGIEEEANVTKAELGGTILKKKKKYA